MQKILTILCCDVIINMLLLAILQSANIIIYWRYFSVSVFISYSTSDEQYAQRLEKAFSLNNIPYWFAPKDIKGGENFADKIASELSKHHSDDIYERIDEDYEHLLSASTELFLLLLSKNSMNSKWVKKELISAVEEEIPVLVLQIDNAPIIDSFKYILRDIQIIKAYHLNKQSMKSLIDEIISRVHFEKDVTVHSENKKLTYQDIGAHPIAEGDPYFIEGKTMITTLSEQCFFLAPPQGVFDDSNNAEYLKSHIFSKEDIVFDSTLDIVCDHIPINGLREMIEKSREKIFHQFLLQENGCYYNNRKYGVNNISSYERTEDISEDPVVRIELYTTDYFTHRVMKDVCKQLATMNNYFKNFNYNQIGQARIFFTSLGINLLLVDHTGNVLLTGRSTNASETYNQHKYSVSVIEGASQSDFDSYEKQVNIRLSILRGLKEELGVSEYYLSKDSLKLYDVFVNPSNQ